MITIINIGVFFYPLTSWKSPNEFRDWSSSSNVRISITNHSPALPCRGGWGNLRDMACGSNWISTISIMSSRLQPGTSHPLVPFLCTSNQQKKNCSPCVSFKIPQSLISTLRWPSNSAHLTGFSQRGADAVATPNAAFSMWNCICWCQVVSIYFLQIYKDIG